MGASGTEVALLWLTNERRPPLGIAFVEKTIVCEWCAYARNNVRTRKSVQVSVVSVPGLHVDVAAVVRFLPFSLGPLLICWVRATLGCVSAGQHRQASTRVVCQCPMRMGKRTRTFTVCVCVRVYVRVCVSYSGGIRA